MVKCWGSHPLFYFSFGAKIYNSTWHYCVQLKQHKKVTRSRHQTHSPARPPYYLLPNRDQLRNLEYNVNLATIRGGGKEIKKEKSHHQIIITHLKRHKLKLPLPMYIALEIIKTRSPHNYMPNTLMPQKSRTTNETLSLTRILISFLPHQGSVKRAGPLQAHPSRKQFTWWCMLVWII